MISSTAIVFLSIFAFQILVGGQKRPTRASKRSGNSRLNMAFRGDLYLRRKGQHAATGLLIVASSVYYGWFMTCIILGAGACSFHFLNAKRASNTRVNDMYQQYFGGLLRKKEVSANALPGLYFFLIGAAIALASFPAHIARLAILHLAVGDPSAALAGRLYGDQNVQRRLRNALSGDKSYAGLVGCVVACTLVSAVYDIMVRGVSMSASDTWTNALVAGVCAGAAESTEVNGWDENLTLPLLSGVFMQASYWGLYIASWL